MSASPRSGAQLLVDQLLIHSVETIFCVPGESYIAVLDALYDQQDHTPPTNSGGLVLRIVHI